MLLTRPSDSAVGAAPSGTSTERENHTTPSKSGSPLVSHAPGTCMSFQSDFRSLSAGVRQSGLVSPSRSATGNAVNGTAFGSPWYCVRNVSRCRVAAM